MKHNYTGYGRLRTDHHRRGLRHKISVKTGQFDIIRSSIHPDYPRQRLQMLIVGFCFGAFLEGAAAGFGAPVAITAARCWSGHPNPRCMQQGCV